MRLTCLSDEYVNLRTKMLFRCSNGHDWNAPFRSLLKYNGCVKCQKNIIKQIKTTHSRIITN